MSVIRRTVLSQVVLAGAAVFLAASLSFASQGELTASDRDALINIRTSANTEAEIIETRPVGDRIEVVSMTKSNEGLIWYKVKVPQTGTVGWVRGDLVKIFGNKKPPQAASKPAKGKPLPKPNAKPKPAAAKPSPAPSPKPSPAASPSPQPSPAASPAPSPSSSPTPDGGGTPAPPEPEVATSTIVSFQTQSYAVRVFSRSGQLRLNLFNRRTNTVALKEVPVQSKAQEDGTVYTYGKELEVTVFVPNSGTTKLTTNVLGTTVEEFAEPTAASTGTPAPTSTATPAPQ